MELDMESLGVLAGVGLLFSIAFWKKYGETITRDYHTFISLPWADIGIMVLIFIALFFVLWGSVKGVKKLKQRKRS